MYAQTYQDISVDSPEDARLREHEALDRVVAMLEDAAKAGPGSRALAEALDKMEALWTIFLDDLSDPYNALPEELRARLISIGLWIVRRASEVRTSDKLDLSGLIAVNASIRDGLR
jgi:flagellar protein FlaF